MKSGSISREATVKLSLNVSLSLVHNKQNSFNYNLSNITYSISAESDEGFV